MSSGAAASPPVRVLVVDDNPDIRTLLRMQLQFDERFDLAGEAVDGVEAIERAEELQPDLVVLDRQMPRLGGVEALPEIRRVAPGAAVVLYTTDVDPTTERAAIAAGAVDVLAKSDIGAFVDDLIGALVRRAGPSDDEVEIRVGPVASDAARLWVENAERILEAVVAHSEVLVEPLPDDVVELFRGFLGEWAAVAAEGGEFRWAARARADDARRVVEHWARVDALDDRALDELGVTWSPPEARPFFLALTTGVLEALHRHERTKRLAERLTEQWAQ